MQKTKVGSATIDNLDHVSSQDDETPVDYAEFESFFLGALRERLELVDETRAEVVPVAEAFLAELASLLGLLREIKTLPVSVPMMQTLVFFVLKKKQTFDCDGDAIISKFVNNG